MEKLIEILPPQDGSIKIRVLNFKLQKGINRTWDVFVDSFSWCVRNHSNDSLFDYEENFVTVESEVDLDDLKSSLSKFGFTFSDTSKKKIMLILKPKAILQLRPKLNIRAVVRNELGIPSIKAEDTASYIESSEPFNLTHSFCIGSQTVSKLLETTMATINLIGIGTGIISCKRFFSQLERVNKVLPKLNPVFKDRPITEFLANKRDADIIEEYRLMYDGDIEYLSKSPNGFLLVNSLDIYEQIYRFGSHNRKKLFAYGDYCVIKPFRWDYIVIVHKDFETYLDGADVISFDNELEFL